MAEKGQPPPAYAPQQGQQSYPGQPQYPPQQQQYAPPGGYPSQQPQYPPPPGQQVYVQQTTYVPPTNRGITASSVGGMLSRLTKGAANTIQREVDRYSNTAGLALFGTGCIVQLISKMNNLALRVLPNGEVDFLQDPNVHNPYSHFKVCNLGYNQVTLNCMGNPTFFLTILKDGRLLGNGDGKFECKFRLHETSKGFMTFESLSCPTKHIAALQDGKIFPGAAKDKEDYSQFSVRLLNPPLQVVPGSYTQTQVVVQHK